MKKLKSILLIDDDSICSWINKTIIEQMDLVDHIECILDGNSALEYLKKACTGHTEELTNCPDLILLDLNMPEMDGFQIMDELSKTEEGKQLIKERTVVLTTSISKKDFEKANQYNIYNYLVKPLTESSLRRVIEQFLQLKSENSRREKKKSSLPDQTSTRAAAERPASDNILNKNSNQPKEN